MGDASLEPGQRMRGLAEAASDFKVDNRIPIRRYFRYTTDTNTLVSFSLRLLSQIGTRDDQNGRGLQTRG